MVLNCMHSTSHKKVLYSHIHRNFYDLRFYEYLKKLLLVWFLNMVSILIVSKTTIVYVFMNMNIYYLLIKAVIIEPI